MPQTIRLSFSGELDLDWFDLQEEQARLLSLLQEESGLISREISARISEATGAEPSDITIHFVEGSIHWFGSVEWLRDAWRIVELLSTAGGAIAFFQAVRDAIDGTLNRRFNKMLDLRFSPFYSPSRIPLLTPAPSNRPTHTLRDHLFGTAALIASLAALIAAIGLFSRFSR